VSGALPSGLSWSVDSTQPSACNLSGSAVGVVTVSTTYQFAVKATDTSANANTAQVTMTLVVRPEFSITQASLADAVAGREYGAGAGCTGSGGGCSQPATTTLSGTAQPAISPTTGASPNGNGPIAVCAMTVTTAGEAANPGGLVIAINPTKQSQCALSSPEMTTAGAYMVSISVTDNPITVSTQTTAVVPANTITIPAPLSLNVNPAITFSVNFDNYPFTPGGTGTAEVPDAVQGRTYGAGGSSGKTSLIFTAKGGLLSTAGLGFSQGTSYSLPNPVACAPFLSTTYQVTTATLTCSSGGAPVNVTPAPTAPIAYALALTVSDPGNTATPSSSASSTSASATRTLMVDPVLSFSLAQAGNLTTTNPANLLDAVSGRTYGVIGGTPTYTPTGGLGANNAGAVGNSYYQWCLSVGTLPATFSSTGNNGQDLNVPCPTQVQSPSETLQATNDLSTVASATGYLFAVQLNDTGNSTTPSATLTNSTTLTVQPPLVATLTQATSATTWNTITALAPGPLLPGVYNRTYGVGGGTPTFTATGGLGAISGGLGGAYQWCISSLPTQPLPTGFLNSGTNLNNLSTCASPVVENTATLMANPITQNVATPTTYTFTVRLDDGGNAAVPSGFAPGTTPDPANAVTTSILVNPQIQLAQSLGATWPDAVNGRSYGSASTGCTGTTLSPACAPAVYSATGGLGGYVWPGATSSLSGITGMTCPAVAVGSATYTCSATTITAPPTTSIPGPASITYSPSVTVTDTPNAATPAATPGATGTDPLSTRTDTLTVDAPLLATLTQGTRTTPITYLDAGVVNRSYGVGNTGCGTLGTAACAAPNYAATGGLGANPTTSGGLGVAAYEWCVPTASAALPAGLGPGAVTPSANCPTSFTTGVTPLILTANSITAAANLYPFTVELDDTGNGSTPSSSSTSPATSASVATSLRVHPVLAISSNFSPGTIPAAVLGRNYGVGSNCSGGTCTALTFTASGGLWNAATAQYASIMPYSLTATSPGLTSGLPAGFNCGTETNVASISCTASPVDTTYGMPPSTVQPGSYVPDVTVTDTANSATPAGTATDTEALNVDAAISLSVNLGAIWPDAVYGRPYGSPASGPAVTGCTGTAGDCTAAIYTASGGLPGVSGYVWPPTAPASSNLGNFGLSTCAVGNSGGTGNTYTCNATSVTVTPALSAGANSITYGPPPNSNVGPTVTVSDTANASTPAATAGSDPASTLTDTLTVDAPLLATLNQGARTSPTYLDAGVVGRTYGYSGSTCSVTPCAVPTYTATGGLGEYPVTNAGAYEWCVNTGSTSLPGGLTGITGTTTSAVPCTTFGPTGTAAATLTAPLSSGITANAGLYPFTVELDDKGNGSTPNSVGNALSVPPVPATSATVATSLRIHPVLAISSNFASASPPVPIPAAVLGRSYGTGIGTCVGGANCLALTFTASGGLWNASTASYASILPISTTATSPGLTSGLPAGFNCGTETSVASISCTASPVDTTYMSTTVQPGSYVPDVTVTDTANSATPAGTQTDTEALNVDASVTLGVTIGGFPYSNGDWPDGVTGRPYGNGGTCNGGSCAPPIFAASNGLGGYSYSAYTSLTNIGFGCSTSGTPAVLTCSAATSPNYLTATSAGSPYGLSVTATDSANASTPAANTGSDPCSILPNTACSDTPYLPVDPEIVIQNLPTIELPTGEAGQPYSVLFSCQDPTAHVCGGTGIPGVSTTGNANAQYTWSASNLISSNSGSYVDTSLNFAFPNSVGQPGIAPFAGTPPIPSPATTVGNPWSVTISVTDNGNATTPSCATAGTCPPSPTFTGYIFPSLAMVGSNGNGALDLFDTSGAGPVFLAPTITSAAAVTPNYVAVSTNGNDVFVADPGAHIVFIGNDRNGTFSAVTHASGLSTNPGNTAAVAVGPQSITGSLNSLNNPYDVVYAYVANAGSDDVQVIDGSERGGHFGSVLASPIKFSLGATYSANGAIDLKVAPTFFVSGERVTHAYVVRPGGDEVCVFDAEPSSGTFLTQIPAFYGGGTNPNADSCIALSSAAGAARFINVSPDGLYAFVTVADAPNHGYLKIIDTNPNSATFETLLTTRDLTPTTGTYQTIGTGDGTKTTFSGTVTPIPPGNLLEVEAGAVTGFSNSSGVITGSGVSGTVIYTTGAYSVTFSTAPAAATPVQIRTVSFGTTNPAGVRVSPDGQTVWVAGEDTSEILGFETALVGSTQFSLAYYNLTPNAPGTEESPIGIAFRPDGAFGLTSLSAASPAAILPFTTAGAGTEVATTNVTTPWGIDHIPNPVLHITTVALPQATAGDAYQSSVVAAGPNRYYTFTEMTSLESTTLAALGLNLSSWGEITGTVSNTASGPYTLYIQVSDQSQPVNNVVVQKIYLTVN